MKKPLLIVLGVLLVGAIAAYAVFNPGRKPGTEVYVTKVEGGDVVSVVTASGEDQARTKVNISSNIFGAIVALPVKEGDTVRKGDVLVRIDRERNSAEANSPEASRRMAPSGVEHEGNRHRPWDRQLRR